MTPSGVPAPYATTAAADGASLAAAMRALLEREGRRPRLLGFGEPMHGEDEFSRLRNGVFAHLVEHAGFRSIALESSAWAGQLVNDHVCTGRGDEDEVLARGFSHGFGESPANRELVRWMRAYNEHRSSEQMVRFAGFDAPTELSGAASPLEPLAVLHTFLDEHLVELGVDRSWSEIEGLVGDEARWSDPAAAMDPSRSVGTDPAVGELRVITDQMRWLLTCETPTLAARSPQQWWRADLAGRTAAGLLAYHAAMARDTSWRWQQLTAIRDTIMADNLQALLAREADLGPTLVFANNQHLRTGTTWTTLGSALVRWQPAGAHLAHRCGPDYAVVGTALGVAAHQGIDTPAPDTVEGALVGSSSGNHLFAADQLRALGFGRPTRTTGNQSYFPVDDTTLDDLDAVLFISEIKGAAPC